MCVIDFKPLQRATFVGLVLQIVLYALGHYSGWVEANVVGFGGMMISASAGYLYAMDRGRGWFPSATGGAIAGGICGLIGIVLSVILGDTQQSFIAIGATISVFVGAVGGVFGQMAANLRALEK
jgi:general stress protein CsbA